VNQVWLLVGVPAIVSIAVNELTAVSPWLASRVVSGAARLWSGRDTSHSAVLQEEWTALLDDCPGKFLKLAYALWFLAGSVQRAGGRHLARCWSWGRGLARIDRAPRALLWAFAAAALIGWWLLMARWDVALPEAYTVPLAAVALVIGFREQRATPDRSSWSAYGPALSASFVPTVGIVLSSASAARAGLLLLGALATLVIGVRGRQQAPVVVAVPAVAVAWFQWWSALDALWVALLTVGVVLLILGARIERGRQARQLNALLRQQSHDRAAVTTD
jgi:hypothetical protein